MAVPVQTRDFRVHLLRRATYGPTPASVASLRSTRNWTSWLDAQLRPGSIPDPEGDTVRGLYPALGWSIARARSIPEEPRPGGLNRWEFLVGLPMRNLGLAIFSRRQLFEVMVDFWSNHLNVPVPGYYDAWYCRHDYDRSVIRRHALGRFSDMLQASATHPAMLMYLDNASSTKYAPNENYGRELLELHTVGIGAGYTERHIRDSARIMTGWTVDWERTGAARYDAGTHSTGQVQVLDFKATNNKADGRAVVTRYLEYLARHPATARHIATKLALRFVSDDPSPALISRLATVYRQQDTNITPVLRALFTSQEFKASASRKVQRPYEDIVSTARVLRSGKGARGLRREALEALYWYCDAAHQPPINWHPPNGYPDVAAAWQGADSMIARFNAHQNLAAGWWPKPDALVTQLPLELLGGAKPKTFGALVDTLARRLVFGPLRPDHRAAVLRYMGKTANSRIVSDHEQWMSDWKLCYVVSLILDSPAHTLR